MLIENLNDKFCDNNGPLKINSPLNETTYPNIVTIIVIIIIKFLSFNARNNQYKRNLFEFVIR